MTKISQKKIMHLPSINNTFINVIYRFPMRRYECAYEARAFSSQFFTLKNKIRNIFQFNSYAITILLHSIVLHKYFKEFNITR